MFPNSNKDDPKRLHAIAELRKLAAEGKAAAAQKAAETEAAKEADKARRNGADEDDFFLSVDETTAK